MASPLVWILAATLLSHDLFLVVLSTSVVEHQKNFYPPGSHGHGGLDCLNPPPHDPHTPSTPTYTPTPSAPSHNPSPSHTPSPSTPSHNPSPSHTPTPSTPSHNPSPSHTPTPSTPTYTPTPSHNPSPHTPTPVIVTPTTPTHVPTPSHPFLDPNHPFTGTCNYWRNHPTIVWGVVGWWCTLGSSFGGHSIPGFPSSLTLPEALSNTRTDGLGALYREGTASLLNSMVNNKFPFSTQQVRDSFVAALGSDKAAAAQARVFQLANEGHFKPRA